MQVGFGGRNAGVQSDASGNFVGTWTRDIAYMTEGCPGAVPSTKWRRSFISCSRGNCRTEPCRISILESGRFAYVVKGCGNKPPTIIRSSS